MAGSGNVTVLAFGSAAEVLGGPRLELTLGSPCTLGELVAQLEEGHPRLKEARGRIRYAINQQYATPESAVKPGDEIAVIPPVSGGALPAARLVRDVIDVGGLVREVENARVGAVATFSGVVRYEKNLRGEPLRALEYTAYEPMALTEMRGICEAACAQYDLHKALLVHRLGTLVIGEISVAAVVSAPHRANAFDACRELIERLKSAVPIFKKEIWQDGRASWVQAV